MEQNLPLFLQKNYCIFQEKEKDKKDDFIYKISTLPYNR